jgi:polyhydroxybutyrate depolymerase
VKTFWIGLGSVMNEMSRMSPLQPGHSSGTPPPIRAMELRAGDSYFATRGRAGRSRQKVYLFRRIVSHLPPVIAMHATRTLSRPLLGLVILSAIFLGVERLLCSTAIAQPAVDFVTHQQVFGDQTGTGSGSDGREAVAARPPDRTIAFTVKGQDRRAIVVNAAAHDTLRPAVIVLHGGMGSAEAMRAKSGFDAVARAEAFMVVYAEGTSFGEGRHAWNTGFLLRQKVQHADDIAYFDTLIDLLVREHGADPSRVFMTGGSNGGMMTFVYAVTRPERLAAVAPVVASMFTFDIAPAVPLPILIINGAKDDEVPLEGGMSRNPLVRGGQQAPFKPLEEVVRFWVKVNRSLAEAEVETRGTVTKKFHAATPQGAATEFVVDSAGGHGWPGSRPRRQGSTPIASFSGAERVWQFFEDKRRHVP